MSTTFTTKAYTLNSLITEVTHIGLKASISDIVFTLSPRAGAYSQKLQVINTFLDGELNAVLIGTTGHGATPRTRLLRALKFRKTHGFFSF